MKTVTGLQECDHFSCLGHTLLACNESAIHSSDQSHQSEARAARCDNISRTVPFQSHARSRVGKFVEVFQGLVLHQVHQFLIGQLKFNLGFASGVEQGQQDCPQAPKKVPCFHNHKVKQWDHQKLPGCHGKYGHKKSPRNRLGIMGIDLNL
jgi:hypothetical protein